MTDRELMQMALDALEAMKSYARAEKKGLRICDESIEALRDRLAQPKPEPVAWFIQYEYRHEFLWREPTLYERNSALEIKPLYAAPVHAIDISQERVDETAKREHEWVGLSDEEAWKCWDWEDFQGTWKSMESKLKEKNS